MFRSLNDNKWISPNKSGFTPGDPWANQLLSVIRDINKFFHSRHKARSDFLDIQNRYGIIKPIMKYSLI